MRKKSEPIKISTIRTQRSDSSNNRENYKKRQSHKTVNINHIKKLENKKEEKRGQDNIISNAYKNVMNVLANLLDNINEEQTNGKSNLQYLNEATHKRKSVNKAPAQKLISYTPQTTILSLNKLNKKNSLNKKNVPPRKSFNIVKRKSINLIEPETLDTSLHLDKKKQKNFQFQTKNNNKLQVKNLFFKPKNKLKEKWTSSKSLITDNNRAENESSFLSKVHRSNIEEIHNKTNNSASSLLGSEKGINNLKLKSQKTKHICLSSLRDNKSQKKIKSYFKSNIVSSSKDIKKSSKKIDISPFVSLQKSVNIDTETIMQRLYEYENNEITRQIDMLPDDYILKSKKKIKEKEVWILLVVV